MKEKCLKLFHVRELIGAVTTVLFIIASVIILVAAIILLSLDHKPILILPIAVFIILCNIIIIVGYRIRRKYAYYVERTGDILDFYFVDRTVSKDVFDCIKIGNFFYDRIVFVFNDNEKIKLCRFPGCSEAIDWISKKDFPNVK